MKTISEIKEKTKDIFSLYPVQKVSLFGSYAKGVQTQESDIDFIVHDSDMGILETANLIQALSEALNENIDLVLEDNVSDVFRFLIRDDEVLIYEKQR